jgi:hypothetical protein
MAGTEYLGKKMTQNKQHMGFGKYTFKRLENFVNLSDLTKYTLVTGYRYFIANTPEHVELAMKNFAIQTGCLTFESIDKEEYEQAVRELAQ